MKKLLTIVLFTLLTTGFAFAGIRDNDDTCDVKVGPAATLLLPYFEVDPVNAGGQTTLFTVTNVTRFPQIAHVTLWTDWGYPVFAFNLYLTGYDVQAINLADILRVGVIAPPNGTSPTTTPGSLSAGASPNLSASLNCAGIPGVFPASVAAALRSIFTTGAANSPFEPGTSCSVAGGVHANAIGYATIDLVSNCTNRLPSDPLYFTTDLLFDNVLIGDYQQLGPHPAGSVAASFDAGGNPMVHIRAVPEGGAAGSNVPTSLPYTFYDRYTPAANRAADRRQPLPSTFAARFIQGGPSAFATNFTIWREGFGSGDCASAKASNAMLVPELVRFDEHENPFIQSTAIFCTCFFPPPALPATSSTESSNSIYPILATSDVGGWIYLNLNNGGSKSYSVTKDIGGMPGPTNAPGGLAPIGATTMIGPRPSQNWVTVTMFGSLGTNRLATEFDAASLGNGCSPAAFLSTATTTTGRPIGPAGGVFVCPPGPTLTNGTTTQCTGTNVNPLP